MSRTRPSQFVTVEVDIADYIADASDEDLAELGLHDAESCTTGASWSAGRDLYGALSALHQQAHPDQPVFVDTCLREPCRSLSLRDLPGLSGR